MSTTPGPLDVGYFTDAQTPSPQDAAKKIIDAFRSSTATSPWNLLDPVTGPKAGPATDAATLRKTVADRLSALIDNPFMMQQDSLNLCGAAAMMCIWATRNPEGFATYATQLFDTGKASIGNLTVAPGSSVTGQSYADMKARMGVVCPQADWMIFSALRNSTNLFLPFVGDPKQDASALTRPDELAAWLQATGESADNQANWLITKGIQHATGLTPGAGTDIVLLINASMFRAAKSDTPETGNLDPYKCTSLGDDNDWISNQFPSHYIILLSPIVPSTDNSTVQFSFWSWGTTFPNAVVPQADFTAFYYGAIIAKMP